MGGVNLRRLDKGEVEFSTRRELVMSMGKAMMTEVVLGYCGSNMSDAMRNECQGCERAWSESRVFLKDESAMVK